MPSERCEPDLRSSKSSISSNEDSSIAEDNSGIKKSELDISELLGTSLDEDESTGGESKSEYNFSKVALRVFPQTRRDKSVFKTCSVHMY